MSKKIKRNLSALIHDTNAAMSNIKHVLNKIEEGKDINKQDAHYLTYALKNTANIVDYVYKNLYDEELASGE